MLAYLRIFVVFLKLRAFVVSSHYWVTSQQIMTSCNQKWSGPVTNRLYPYHVYHFHSLLSLPLLMIMATVTNTCWRILRWPEIREPQILHKLKLELQEFGANAQALWCLNHVKACLFQTLPYSYWTLQFVMFRIWCSPIILANHISLTVWKNTKTVHIKDISYMWLNFTLLPSFTKGL